MNTVRIGVLGCAEIARRRMLPAMLASPEITLVAVASRDGVRAAEVARTHGCQAVTGYAALLARDDLDAVYIPLPAALHAEWIEAALRSGRHVLAEKPMTLDPERTEALLALAAQRRLALMENVMFVHHGQHRAVRRALAEGAIGELRSFRAEFTVPALPATDIRYQPELGGGALWDVGVYPVRAALHLLGPELTVAGAALTTGAGRQVDTAGAALLRGPAGVTAALHWGLDHAYRSSYELCGSAGRISVDRAFTPPAADPPRISISRGSAVRELTLPPEDQVAGTLAAFVGAVRSGGTADPEPLRQIRLMSEIRRVATAPGSPMVPVGGLTGAAASHRA